MSWRGFVIRLLCAFFGGSAVLFTLLLLLDPWGTLPFRSPLPRVAADHSQRWAYPELARDTRFNSAVIGDSASRLLNPVDLDPATGGRFVNLAMVHSYAWEQSRLLDVFMAAHKRPHAVLIGLDRGWCERGDDLEHFGYEPIPEWLYDGDRFAELSNLLNLHAIDTAWRSLTHMFGKAPRPYDENGWALIGVDSHPYDPALARALIANGLAEPWPTPAEPDPRSWHYVALDWLRARLDRLPAETRKLLVFVPRYHLYPAPGSAGAAMIDECKRRVTTLAAGIPNTDVYDMSSPNRFTSEDERWWDTVHLRPEAMAEVSRALADAIRGEVGPDVRVLYASPGHERSMSAR